MGNSAAKEALSECCDNRTIIKIAEVLRVSSQGGQTGSSGLGLVVTRIPSGPDEGRLLITSVIIHGAAAKQTMLQKDDVILKIDNLPTIHFNVKAGVPSPLLGASGTTVALMIFRPSTERVFQVSIIRSGAFSPDEQLVAEWNQVDQPIIRKTECRMFHSSSTKENHPPLRPIRSPDLNSTSSGACDLSVIREETSADLLTPQADRHGPLVVHPTVSSARGHSQGGTAVWDSYQDVSKPTARRPPPRSMLPPLPSSDIHAFAALPSACGTILQPISFNAARPPEDKDTILPSKLPPPGRSSADESALAAVVITFRPIEAARTVREPPPREDRDSAGRLLRPTGQTLSRVGSSSGFKSYAMDKILRSSNGGDVVTPRGKLIAAAEGSMIAEGYIIS